MSEENLVRFRFDPKTGEIELSAPPSEFEKAAENAKILVEGLVKHVKTSPSDDPTTPLGKKQGVADPGSQKAHAAGEGPSTKKSGRSRNSSGRPGRIGSFVPVDFAMDEEKERALLAFYREKAPVEQAEKVAVAIYKGSELLGRSGFDYNEIYTLMRLGGEKALPKALDVVVSRMVNDNWATREHEGVALKFPAKDHVEQNLPA